MTLRRHPSRGQALVEFALVFPVLVVIVFGFIDVSRAVFSYANLENAARSGTRVGAVNQILTSPGCSRETPIVNPNPATAKWSIKACTVSEGVGLDLKQSDVTVTFGPPPSQPTLGCAAGSLHVGCLVNVKVDYAWSPLTPLIGQMFPSIAMSVTCQSTIERVFP